MEELEKFEEEPVKSCENEETSSYHELDPKVKCDEEVMVVGNYGAPNNPENFKGLVDVVNHNAAILEWLMRRELERWNG